MANDRRRTTLGNYASAALPLLWAAIAHRGWTHAEAARALGVDTGMLAKILYGERRAGRETAVLLATELDIPVDAWSRPLPKGWRPSHKRAA